MITASEIGTEAHAHIENGWTTGKLEDEHGNVCSLGAIERAVKNHRGNTLDEFIAACTAGNRFGLALRDAMSEMEGYSLSVTSFNDTKSNKEPVAQAFWKATCGLQEQGE